MLLCAGEALIDMLPRQTEAGEAGFAPYPGGSVFNTAVAAARLGTPTSFFTGLSNDLFGARLEAVLTTAGVKTDLIARSDRPTTLAFVTLSDGQASYAFYDENTAGRMLSPGDLPTLPDAVSTVFFGGISLAVEPCAEAYLALAEQVRGTRLVMLDPNIRPSFIADEARFRARMDAFFACADIVKLSDEDLAWLMGEGSLEALAWKLQEKGPSLVLVTQGADGATAYGPQGQEVGIAAERVDVIDTVGAGDTFNAGFLSGLADAACLSREAVRAGLEDTILADALDLGVKAAAITVSRAGANPPHRDELP